MFDQIEFFPALRCGDKNLVIRLQGKRFAQQCFIFNLVRKQELARAGLVIIKLRDERRENFVRRHAFVCPRKIGPVAPVLPGAEKEHLDAGHAVLLRDSKDIGFINTARIDALVSLNHGKRRYPVTVNSSPLEIEIVGSLFHLSREIFLNTRTFARQKLLGLIHKTRVIGKAKFHRYKELNTA